MAGSKGKFDTRKLVLAGILTAITVLLQFTSFKFGTFQIALSVIPITVGAALIGVAAGGWLGLVSATVILLNGDSALFLAINPAATIVTVIVKGVLSGLAAGAVYRLLRKANKLVGAIAASVVAPVVNTGIFTLSCFTLFKSSLNAWSASGLDVGEGTFLWQGLSPVAIVFVMLIGANFFVELAVNLVFSSAIVRVVEQGSQRK
ncbi:MAG: ECF transporter S component [Oscillospiraceae bacterium]|jgi:uncharacterized membrane protein|nr:ECF transporter S component [Oscillospiraceae bacterium]